MFVFNIVTILYKPHHKQNCYENLATILRAVILSLYQFFVSLIDLWQSFVYLQLNLFVERIRKWSMEWLMEKLLPLIAPSNPIQPRGFDLDGLSIPARNWIPCHNHDTRSGDLPHKWVDWSLNYIESNLYIPKNQMLYWSKQGFQTQGFHQLHWEDFIFWSAEFAVLSPHWVEMIT